MKSGQILKERYRVDAELSAKGGFGIVYIGTDLQTGRQVAVKEIRPEQKKKEADATQKPAEETWEKKKEGFLEEARILEKLRELPQVVQVFDYSDEGDTAWIAMEYLKGETLKNAVRRKGKPNTEEAYRTVTELLSILEKVHGCGILHRDIAPDNIYILSSGRMKLFDFGIAHAFGGEQGEKAWVDARKKGYSPLEQIQKSKQQGPQTDVYAAAAVYYELLTGTKPPDAGDRRKKDQLIPPVRAGAAVSEEEEKVILEALAVEAADRIPSAGVFLGKLREAHHKTTRRKVQKRLITAAVLLLITGSAVLTAVKLRGTSPAVGTSGEPSLEGKVAAELTGPETAGAEAEGSEHQKPGPEGSETDGSVSTEHGMAEAAKEGSEPVSEPGAEQAAALPVSEETGQVIVPELTGLNQAEAAAELQKRSLSYHKTAEPSALVPKGLIIRQEPAGGTAVETDSAVEIVISLGMQEESSTAPIVTLAPRSTAAPTTKAPASVNRPTAQAPTQPPATRPPATEIYYEEPTISENIG